MRRGSLLVRESPLKTQLPCNSAVTDRTIRHVRVTYLWRGRPQSGGLSSLALHWNAEISSEGWTAVAENMQDNLNETAFDQACDPVFQQEQDHLSDTYAKLEAIAKNLSEKMERRRWQAAKDKDDMQGEVKHNFASDGEAQETYVDYAVLNNLIRDYNLEQDADSERLAAAAKLLEQPYFAKISLEMRAGAPAKDIYIGLAGVADENYRRMVVDWRSPVAEVYYNQENGATSYEANGRTIKVNLLNRRQFDIEGKTLRAYFDSDVAIEDSLLLQSLSAQRSEHMKAITATIQKEQNLIIRHEDVPALLVAGIAGSGKTSVLLQRIAYLFYRNRGSLDPRQVFLISPNPVFAKYIENVLPDLGERNPETITYHDLCARLLPASRNPQDKESPLELLWKIDRAVEDLRFELADLRDIKFYGVRLVSAGAIMQLMQKYPNVPAGPHLVTLVREELFSRLDARLKQMAATETVQDELLCLSLDEQVRLFNAPYDPQTEQEARDCALTYLQERFSGAVLAIERDEWLRIDRIGMRLLGVENLPVSAWLYLNMAVTGLGNPDARYVMIDEVQDYTPDQLAVMARFFRRAHFMLLGDPHQAIRPETASYAQIREVFERLRGSIEDCQLLTSYRSTPEITALFAGLLPESERMQISAVQRADVPPALIACPTEDDYEQNLRRVIREAAGNDGLTAVVVPWKSQLKRLQKLLGDDTPQIIGQDRRLPSSGVLALTLPLAKGLEFDHVIIPDAGAGLFPENDHVAQNRLYTTISRATRTITILSNGPLTPLLDFTHQD